MKIQDLGKEDLLNAVGLQSTRPALWAAVPGIALFGAGLVVGTGLGMLLAPKSGPELRSDLADRFESMKDYAAKATNMGHRGDTEETSEPASTNI